MINNNNDNFDIFNNFIENVLNISEENVSSNSGIY